MKLVMRDQHRERILGQLGRERQQQEDEISKVAAQREAKKLINEQLRGRIEGNIERERDRTEQRLEAARVSRARRDEIASLRRKDIEDKMARAQVRFYFGLTCFVLSQYFLETVITIAVYSLLIISCRKPNNITQKSGGMYIVLGWLKLTVIRLPWPRRDKGQR